MQSPIFQLVNDKEKFARLTYDYQTSYRNKFEYDFWTDNSQCPEFAEIIQIEFKYNYRFEKLFAGLFMERFYYSYYDEYNTLPYTYSEWKNELYDGGIF